MQQTVGYKQKSKVFLSILLPILITQVGLFAMNLFDTMMSGNVSAEDLAGVAIGSSIWLPIFTGITGILMAITPIVAQLVGAKRNNEVSFSVIQGIYVAVVVSIIVVICGVFLLEPLLSLMNLENEVRRIAKQYLIALSAGIAPLFIYTVLRCFIDALGHTRITMIITLLALPINFFFNYVLIFGHFGFPKLGGVGAGVATSITYWCITIMTIVIVLKQTPFIQYEVLRRFPRIHFASWKEILTIGLPIGFAIFFESSIFAVVTLLMSTFDTTTIASHQAAINFSTLFYMVPLSISMALTIVVGFEVGAKRLTHARQYSVLGIVIAVLLSLLCAAFIYLFKEPIASLYTTDPNVLQLTQHFLIYAIFFQLSDALATPIQGALRGYKDVNTAFVITLIAYWGIGLPSGFIIATFTSFGPFGYWLGFIIGLAFGATGLLYRLLLIQKRERRKIFKELKTT
ncbi:MATE family efflux transporter [Anaerobacillus sp. MEB173]|uniref:MATE family efflux transporter n=1 Tax=Anaerobacillus sp. MEB173 TaxID=3383345 RepID=UPI003F8FD78E